MYKYIPLRKKGKIYIRTFVKNCLSTFDCYEQVIVKKIETQKSIQYMQIQANRKAQENKKRHAY